MATPHRHPPGKLLLNISISTPDPSSLPSPPPFPLSFPLHPYFREGKRRRRRGREEKGEEKGEGEGRRGGEGRGKEEPSPPLSASLSLSCLPLALSLPLPLPLPGFNREVGYMPRYSGHPTRWSHSELGLNLGNQSYRNSGNLSIPLMFLQLCKMLMETSQLWPHSEPVTG